MKRMNASTAKEIVMRPQLALKFLLSRECGRNSAVWWEPIYSRRCSLSLSSPLAHALCNLKKDHLSPLWLLPPLLFLSFRLSLWETKTIKTHRSPKKKRDLFCSTWKLLHLFSPRTPCGGSHCASSAMRSHVSIWLMLQPASEENVFEDLQQCHWLMLRDSPCLFQWQCCNDFRRQTDWRQDPLDYFVSDIKRPRYTQWKDQGQEQWVLPHLNWHNYKKGVESTAKPCEGQKSTGKRRTLFWCGY